MIVDWKLHLAVGCGAVLSALAIIWIGSHYGPGAAAAFSTTVLGGAYEGVQAYRKEGDPSLRDAAVTAAPGYIFWLFVWIGSQ